MPPDAGPARLPLRHAIALGALHGPAELLPVSSSAHVALVPRLLGWPYPGLEPDIRKAFEVALHTGTLIGLLGVAERPPLRLALLATLPAAIAGYALEGPIETRLGGPRVTAAGLLAGSALLSIADACGPTGRTERSLGMRDALAVGAAQATALVPGLSRLGMTVAAARALGLSRDAAFDLGRSVGLPLMGGATLLKAVRLCRGGLAPELRGPFAAGMVAALVATRAAAPLRRRHGVRGAALERVLLALATLNHETRMPT
jgi:undecaprenyl-diphosphatase